jgi:predicted N-acetyltransferase YhbS
MSELEADYSKPAGADYEETARDRVRIRTMEAADLPAMISIDRKILGVDRSDYFKNRLAECVKGACVFVSLVAENDGMTVGFIMARVDYGEFGRPANVATIDTLGIHPDFTHQQVGTGLMEQLKVNLAALGVERIITRVTWNNFPLMSFMAQQKFRKSQRLCFRRRIQ